MTSDMPQEQWEERDVCVPGEIDLDRQSRAESVLGQTSYWLLKSRASRYGGMRTYVVEILVREFTECLQYPGSPSAFVNAQVLLWAAWSHTFMHLEDTTALLHATGEFGKQSDVQEKPESDLIRKRFLSFGDRAVGEGASPRSVLEKVTSSFCDARRALWLPERKEWRELCPGAPDEDYGLIPQTTRNLQRVARGVLNKLKSESGRKWYESYLRFKHGMSMVALDLFHTKASMEYPPGRVPDKETVSAEAAREMRRMRILMSRDPRSPERDGCHLQSFDCTEGAAKQALGSSQRLSEIEAYVCKSICHRAESEGTREFFVIRKAGGKATDP